METDIKDVDAVISNWADYCEKRIMESGNLKSDEIKSLFRTAFRLGLKEMVTAVTTSDEREYLKLLQQQSKLKLNSPQYVKAGYQLSILKKQKAFGNRILNVLNKEQRFLQLSEFVANKYGEEVMEEYYKIHEARRIEAENMNP